MRDLLGFGTIDRGRIEERVAGSNQRDADAIDGGEIGFLKQLHVI